LRSQRQVARLDARLYIVREGEFVGVQMLFGMAF
jgi:hypothetical protein